MTITAWTRVMAAVVVLAAVLAIGFSWRAEMRDRDQLAAELASTKQALAEADARQRDRDAKLADTLAAIAVEKHTVQSPAQIVMELPRQMGLPAPITLQTAPGSGTEPAKAAPGGQGSSQSSATAASAAVAGQGQRSKDPEAARVQGVVPGEDLKPLYDFAMDCKACQAKLAASDSDLVDEQGKTKALTKERDDALRAARGGSIWRRIARASKWMLIGAAAGAVAARVGH